MDAFSQTSDQSEDEVNSSEDSSDSDIVDREVLTSKTEESKNRTAAYRGPSGKFLLKWVLKKWISNIFKLRLNNTSF